jgi:uncharacterized protein DUF6362
MSHRRSVGYAMRAAQAAKGSGSDADLAIAGIGEIPTPHARPAVPGRAPLAGDRIRPKAPPQAPRVLWRATPRPPARQIETQALDDQDMLDAAPDLEETKSRLAEAADALRRLTMNGIKPSRLRSQWPDIVQRAEEAYGWTAERMRPPRPSPAQITRMDEAIGWLLWLDAEERKLVWARSMGLSWRKIEDLDGRSVRTLQTLFAGAMRRILARRVRS